MDNKNIKSGWYHSIIATYDNRVICVTTRDFNHDAAGLLHKF
jgi:hypothetical protein